MRLPNAAAWHRAIDITYDQRPHPTEYSKRDPMGYLGALFWDLYLQPFCSQYRKKFSASSSWPGFSETSSAHAKYRESYPDARKAMHAIMTYHLPDGQRFLNLLHDCYPSGTPGPGLARARLQNYYTQRKEPLRLTYGGTDYTITQDRLTLGAFIDPVPPPDQYETVSELADLLVFLGAPYA